MTAQNLHTRIGRKAAAELAGVSPARISQLADQLGRERDPVTEEVTFDAARVAAFAAQRRLRSRSRT